MRQKWVFSHYFLCSFNQYFLSTHCVQDLMFSAVVEDTNLGSAQPLRSTKCRAEEGHKPVDPVFPVAKSQPGGCSLKAGSKLFSGDGIPASGGQAAVQFWVPMGSWAVPQARGLWMVPNQGLWPFGKARDLSLTYSRSSSAVSLSIQAGVSHL